MPVQEMAVSPVKSLYWEQFPPMTQRRVYCTPVYHEGLLYVLGGCSETGAPLDSVEVLDVESQTWSQLPPLPTARAGGLGCGAGGPGDGARGHEPAADPPAVRGDVPPRRGQVGDQGQPGAAVHGGHHRGER
ncbi:hypothetical protein CgunFtcFv8_000190 [Champsocephalus gunnari]|uniref:Kelch domain-containing protein 8B n=1 Tax=Champsocephalus gunnari TaxID=52237 RepID=A0AAN8HPL4_CHAGU|nr:hypothetical protein CgunFtcFv8_000190 [Champsocephalus gunnari]